MNEPNAVTGEGNAPRAWTMEQMDAIVRGSETPVHEWEKIIAAHNASIAETAAERDKLREEVKDSRQAVIDAMSLYNEHTDKLREQRDELLRQLKWLVGDDLSGDTAEARAVIAKVEGSGR